MKEKLQSLLCLKINAEYQKYKDEQLKLSSEEVYANAYQIQSIMCIYELLLEMVEEFSEEILSRLITFPELINYLYERWLQADDSADEEMISCLKHEILEIRDMLFGRKGGMVA